MNDISVVDNSTAWASTFGDMTTRCRKDWETVKAGGDSWVSIITGVDKNTAWFSSRDSLLFSTLDGGKTWNKGVVGELKNIFSVNFIDGKNGFVSGYSNLLSKEDEAVYQIWGTKNGGNSWELINAKFDFDPTEIRFITTKFGIICGSGMMLRTEMEARPGRRWMLLTI